jgi:hypothetical protein
MNPISVICGICGRDVLIKPKIEEDEEAICLYCYGPLWGKTPKEGELNGTHQDSNTSR